jgi:hypothetical protein
MTATVTLTWASDTDPAVGWNLYFKHYSTPNALAYIGTRGPSAREAVFNNLGEGLYEVGLSRVESINNDGADRPIEGPIAVKAFNIVDGELAVTCSPFLTGLTIVHD